MFKKKVKKVICCSLILVFVFSFNISASDTANETISKSELELELELKYPSDLDFEQNYIQKNILKSHNVTPDEATKAIEDEEDYIINLINSLLGENSMTDLSNWEYNLKFLEDNYDEIVNIKDVNIFYVDSYIEAYTFVKLSKYMPETSVENGNEPAITPFFLKSFQEAIQGKFLRIYLSNIQIKIQFYFN